MRGRLQIRVSLTSETSNPLTIEKPAEPMTKIPKGVFKKTLHNPNARDAANYFVVEDLAQTPCAMLALEVLQGCTLSSLR